MDNATIWKIIDTYFHDNPQALVNHHIDSYDDFYKNGVRFGVLFCVLFLN